MSTEHGIPAMTITGADDRLDRGYEGVGNMMELDGFKKEMEESVNNYHNPAQPIKNHEPVCSEIRHESFSDPESDFHSTHDKRRQLSRGGSRISARHSSFWLLLAIGRFRHGLKRHGKIEEHKETVLERQRYSFILGWGSSIGHMGLSDRSRYITQDGKRSQYFPKIHLPPSESGPEWQWITQWEVDMSSNSSDANGWEYFKSFSDLSRVFASNGGSASQSVSAVGRTDLSDQGDQSLASVRYRSLIEKGKRRGIRRFASDEVVDKPEEDLARAGLVFRQRRWVRVRAKVPPSSERALLPQPVPNKRSGWLKNFRPHRKLWRNYYFVVDEGILRYYRDESLTNLRGELLLYNVPCRVQYVDIRVARKPHAFQIETREDSLLLQAHNSAERDEWMYWIEEVILWDCSFRAHAGKTQSVSVSDANVFKGWENGPGSAIDSKANEDGRGCVHQNNSLRLSVCSNESADMMSLDDDARYTVKARRSLCDRSISLAEPADFWNEDDSSPIPDDSNANGSSLSRTEEESAATLSLVDEQSAMPETIENINLPSIKRKSSAARESTPRHSTTAPFNGRESRSFSVAWQNPDDGPALSSDEEEEGDPLQRRRRRCKSTSDYRRLQREAEMSHASPGQPLSRTQHVFRRRKRPLVRHYEFKLRPTAQFAQYVADDVVVRMHCARFVARFSQYDRGWFRPQYTPEEAKSLLADYRGFIEALQRRLIDRNVEVLGTPDHEEEDLLANEESDRRTSTWMESVRLSLVRELENAVFLPTQSIIYSLCESRVSSAAKQRGKEKWTFLAQQDQAWFEIEPRHQSPSGWRAAISVLESINGYSLPVEKAGAILETASVIQDTFEQEHPAAEIELALARRSSQTPGPRVAQGMITPGFGSQEMDIAKINQKVSTCAICTPGTVLEGGFLSAEESTTRTEALARKDAISVADVNTGERQEDSDSGAGCPPTQATLPNKNNIEKPGHNSGSPFHPGQSTNSAMSQASGVSAGLEDARKDIVGRSDYHRTVYTDDTLRGAQQSPSHRQASRSSPSTTVKTRGVQPVLSQRQASRHCLGADDFLPIFIYVLSHARIRDPLIVNELLGSTLIESLRVGQIGYYVTMFEAAVAYIQSVKHPKEGVVERRAHGSFSELPTDPNTTDEEQA